MNQSEKRFERDIEAFLLSEKGGYTTTADKYDPEKGLYVNTLIEFVKKTQPREWERFAKIYSENTVNQFCTLFDNACDTDGLLSVLRYGFRHRGIRFFVCFFKPETTLNKTARIQYESNVCCCVRQWHYSKDNRRLSVDMLLTVNGIPLMALELKNQYTNQNVNNAVTQWKNDRDPREICFRLNKRVLAYFCADHTHVLMITKLERDKTYFLPFNQGSNGAGKNGGAGNPPNPDGYPTAYLWENVLQKDSMLDIVRKFIHFDKKGKRLIFPRYHQLDVVRKLVADVEKNGTGKNYLIQHSAGSGKSNSIAWTAYRLAALHDTYNKPIFHSVIIITDRTVLDKQLQETVSGFDHTLGLVETIDEKKTSKDLLNAINNGSRIIVTTLQKFPVIYEQVDSTEGKHFAVIVDEAHSSQTGTSAMKLKTALYDRNSSLKEYAQMHNTTEEEITEPLDKITEELMSHGQHKNLSFFAFTATPKDKTLDMFGVTTAGKKEKSPFHVYSMKQAIEEGFIMNVLENYMTYHTFYQIGKRIEENPEVYKSKAIKQIHRFVNEHPQNIGEKSEIIIDTFLTTTAKAIGSKGKMMVVTPSRISAVEYFQKLKNIIKEKHYENIDVLVAFSGTVKFSDSEEEFTEQKLNIRKDGSHIAESQTKEEFHNHFNILVVAEKYQTGFDEPLLHTMIVDKKLRDVKCVQTLSRLNRTHPDKKDTFILDFVNTADEIKEAFQKFYNVTTLSEEINIDLIYQTQHQLADFHIYTKSDIDNVIKIYLSDNRSDHTVFGKMTSVLQPVDRRYNEKSPDEKYNFRRKLRSFVKWYGYIAQICRMFDRDLHEEYIFCQNLLRIIPPETTLMMDLENVLQLEFYKIKKEFEGNITLTDTQGTITTAQSNSTALTEEQKEPLQEIIEKINQTTGGDFTEADRVILKVLHDRMKEDKKLMKTAKSSDPRIFMESIFPKSFDTVAQKSYVEQTQAFTSLFQDRQKYQAIMTALAEFLYKEFTG